MISSTVVLKFSSNYVPYGSNYQMTGKEEFMYIGQPYSSVTGLYYFGARYYDVPSSYYSNRAHLVLEGSKACWRINTSAL